MRTWLKAAALAATLASLGLAGCASSGGTTTSTLTLAQVQAQAAAIQSGIDAANTLAQASTTMSLAQKQAAQQAATAVDAAEAAVGALTASGTITQDLTAFDGAAQQAMPSLALVFAVNPATEAAIELGLGLKDAFIGGVGATATLASGSSAAVGAAPGHVAAPVPVPIPTRKP